MSEYRNGYGQAKADSIDRINELLREVEDAMRYPDPRFGITPSDEAKKVLRIKRDTLRWMRTVIKKTVRCPR